MDSGDVCWWFFTSDESKESGTVELWPLNARERQKSEIQMRVHCDVQ